MAEGVTASTSAPWGLRLLAAALLLSLVVPRMTQRGMFLDGVTYAVVARNMADGVGSLWKPAFSATVYHEFYEQPPLGMGLQALAFAILGDHLAVERIYSVVVFGLHAILIVAIWRLLLPRRYDFLPLFFWILPAAVTWAVVNNMLENTQALFTTLAVFCVLRGVRETARFRTAVWGAAAGLSVAAAVLVKGPVGLFPLAVPPLLLILKRSDWRGAIGMVWLAMLATVAVVAAALAMSDGSRMALSAFVESHLVPTLQGKRNLARNPADIVRHLALGIWARMAVLVAIIWAVRWRASPRFEVKPAALLFLAIGLVASLPLLVSPVLVGHYLLPAVPFFALSAAAMSLPAFHRDSVAPRQPRHVVPAVLALALIAAAVSIIHVRGSLERRDAAFISALEQLQPVLPANTILGTCSSAADDWGMHGYFQRFFRDSLDARGVPVNGWFLVADQSCAAPDGCRLRRDASPLQLYRCS
jgi:4-amino-4-deoxy-L-arabinose transferase-like glycosyltransferase